MLELTDPSIERKSVEVNGAEPNDSEEDDTTDLDSPVSHTRRERYYSVRETNTSQTQCLTCFFFFC